MKQVTLVCTVGRAPAQPLASFEYSDSVKAETACDAIQARKSGELIASGVGLDRVSFERVYTDSESVDGHGQPKKQPAQFKKGVK